MLLLNPHLLALPSGPLETENWLSVQEKLFAEGEFYLWEQRFENQDVGLQNRKGKETNMKNVVITGSSTGIGLGLAKEFLN